MEKIKRGEVVNLLRENKGLIFSVVFVKRTTGEVRHMTCRFEVKTKLTGGELAFNPKSKGLVVVYDMAKEGYRMINLETLSTIKMKGIEYEVIN